MKHKSLDHDNGAFDSTTSLMRSIRAFAAVTLAPLGILLIIDKFDLQVIKCWCRLKSTAS